VVPPLASRHLSLLFPASAGQYQAETSLIQLFRFPEPALSARTTALYRFANPD
jgi:hypothetical protein